MKIFLIKKRIIGFTMIELLIVISIIGLLAGILLVRFTQVEKNSRDIVRRRSDLNQYRNALENYSIVHNGVYACPSPNAAPQDASNQLCTLLGTTYLGQCPTDPRQDGSTYYYRYQCSTSMTLFLLYAYMEDSKYYFVCSNGAARENASIPTYADCGYTQAQWTN